MAYSLPAHTVLGELKLRVRNLAHLITFYTDVIGLQVLNRDSHKAELTADGKRALLVLEELPNAITMPERSTTGLYHFAILVPSRKQLGLSLRRLAEYGVRIGQADHLVSEALYLSDPEGNGIEIYRDRPRDEWEWEGGNVKMASDPLDIPGILREAEDSPWQGLPPETIMGHIHLHIGDLAKARAFYCDLLGWEMAADMSRMMRALFISAGGYHHHIGLNVWAGVGAPQPPANATGLDYFKVVLPSAAELDEVVARVRESGVEIAQQNGDWVVSDPFGNEIRLGLAV
ncbi:VOC family protein [Cohnella yongneupensis]|uniref:VOC family protein n=1 Tax=Cohnella yongneupensis TaxID=425006 RepID=A0ABW0R2E4_9BACL